ncbi:putative late blight resistance protein homolog R1A-3 [Primulina eburnea]|uniref:putative late blight resistance protein homolog R1A-3 n=1 Tax=Primulina eburnea TaxID=1245227 RepID=UPI003C6C6297
MAAYAALLSLVRSLHQILDLQQHIDPLHKEKIISLHEKVDSIVTFLEDYSGKHRGRHDRVGNEIRNAAYEAQDFVDSYLGSVSTTHDDRSSFEARRDHEVSLDRDLDMAFERIDFILDETAKMKNRDTAEDLRSRTFSSPVDHSSTVEVTVNKVVGFDDDLNVIKECLYEDSSKLQIIPIVGMGGIGKTTLARRTYEDSLRAQYFDILGWTTVSGEYQRRDILLELLQSFKKYTTDLNERSGESEAQLATLVHKNLSGRRYLIVIDDIWSTKAWDDLKMAFPDNDNGSRILLTTRLSDVADYAGSSGIPIHQMKLLNEDQSWKLLEEKIFGKESCPLHLVELGKKVARNCKGLPLTIVVVAGLLLSSGNKMEEELWESLLENISSMESTISVQCSKILCLSYDWLPLRLKPCFLYIAAFPEDFEIDVSELIMLWVAEGFLKPSNESKCLEDVGKGCLEDLVKRNMILVSEKWPDGELLAVGIHDLLRKICITKAEEEGFLHHVSSTRNVRNDAKENPKRRLIAHSAYILEELETQDSSLRTIFYDMENTVETWDFPTLSPKFRHLSTLNSPNMTWCDLSGVISTFVNLRYISFFIDDTISHLDQFFASLSKLPNLETIIANVFYNEDLQLPYEILRMPKLRHLIMSFPYHLSDPSNIGIINKSDLQTLDKVSNFIFTEDVIKILVNLKKLTVVYEGYAYDQDDFNLNNLFRLQNLEELEFSIGLHHYTFLPDSCSPSLIWNYVFPISLKKLTLQGVPFPWENMTIIGSLPDLQVLKIVENCIERVSEWTTMGGQFLQLKLFYSSLDYLVKWEVEKEHLPSLESLFFEGVRWIDEIPYGLGEIDSLRLIELRSCRVSLVNSAKRIQKQHDENGDYAFQVNVVYSEYMKNFYRSI